MSKTQVSSSFFVPNDYIDIANIKLQKLNVMPLLI